MKLFHGFGKFKLFKATAILRRSSCGNGLALLSLRIPGAWGGEGRGSQHEP